ncbi:hypothetical protein HaLaN_27730 [Haematococcus lacustris]|uniref:Uncharacterized protein n=1 Tax=Haematococcus lacustris TaxID=44745 RepID=A0A6A0A985_HAELA|nr:hypothetical protein HaLaN_27730 [Haematococcus lacustris]
MSCTTQAGTPAPHASATPQQPAPASSCRPWGQDASMFHMQQLSSASMQARPAWPRLVQQNLASHAVTVHGGCACTLYAQCAQKLTNHCQSPLESHACMGVMLAWAAAPAPAPGPEQPWTR